MTILAQGELLVACMYVFLYLVSIQLEKKPQRLIKIDLCRPEM